ncbi:hypothetical protein Tco_0789891, partial [Tanacetum coccineum]
ERFAEIERIRFAFRLCQSSRSVVAMEHSSRWSLMLSRFRTNAEKLKEVSMSSSNDIRDWEASFEVLDDFFSFDLESLDDSTSLLDFILFIPQSDPAEGSRSF